MIGKKTLPPISPEIFVHIKKGNFKSRYELGEVLGTGAFATVYQVTEISTGIKRALKMIKKTSMIIDKSFFSEFSILRTMDHLHISKLLELFQDKDYYYLITELCTGGELFERIASQKHFNEYIAAGYIKQILSAVTYLHERNICHRDLKPENLLFEDKDGDLLKLIDFGLAAKLEIGDKLTEKLGSPYYIAPEVLSCDYNEKCDIWSCGVITYVMLCGYPPFFGKSDDEILKKIKSGKYSFEGPSYAKIWTKISSDAKDIIQKMLTFDYNERPSALDLLNHPWIVKNVHNQIIDKEVLHLLSTFSARNKLKQAILEFIALFYATQKDKKKLEESFRSLDKDHNGTLSFDELVEGYSQVHGDAETAKRLATKIMEEADLNLSGQIDYTEFVIASAHHDHSISQEKIKRAFSKFDQNGDGYIDRQELCDLLGGADIDEEEWIKIIEDCDTNKDGRVSYDEFTAMFMKNKRKSLSSVKYQQIIKKFNAPITEYVAAQESS